MSRQGMAGAALVLGGALWGLIWLPLRFLADLGLTGAWPGLIVYAATAILVLGALAWPGVAIRAPLGPLAVCGLLTGAAFSLYATSLMLTDVVRAILLFYLTPVWGTMLGVMVLGERLSAARLVALGLALAGLAVVLGVGQAVPLPRNAGDWLALASGLCWALGALRIYQMGNVGTFDQVAAFAVGSLVVTAACMALAPGVLAAGTTPGMALTLLPVAGLMALYVLPMLVLTVWPARVLTPGRVGLLLMSDVVVGVISAAIWAGEPFGWREATGSVLIVAAAAVEVLGRQDT